MLSDSTQPTMHPPVISISPTTLKAQQLITKVATKKKGHKWQPKFMKALASEDKQLLDDLATE